jgi:hypothetical protein
MSEARKKPFKETRVGSWLKDKAPAVLDTVGDLLPSNGVFGVVKNLIEKTTLNSEERKEINALLVQAEKEFFALEIQDRDSARIREVEVAKTSKHDWLMYLTGFSILSAFCVVGYAAIWLEVKTESFIRFETMVETLTVAICGYYFGASKQNLKFK